MTTQSTASHPNTSSSKQKRQHSASSKSKKHHKRKSIDIQINQNINMIINNQDIDVNYIQNTLEKESQKKAKQKKLLSASQGLKIHSQKIKSKKKYSTSNV